MNGIELLELIKEGKIENDTSIDVYYDDEDLGRTLISQLHYIDNQIHWREGTFKVSYLYNDSYSFQILGEEKIGIYDYCDNYEVMSKTVIANNFLHLNEDLKTLVDEINKLKHRDK